MADKKKTTKKRSDLRIVGNGTAERTRAIVNDYRHKTDTRLAELMKASNASLGIKSKKEKKK